MSLSAVVVAYNEEKYIAGCLESILGQTRPVREIILVDDSSTDRTVEIAEQYPVDIYTVDQHNIYKNKRLSIFAAANDIVLAVDGDTFLKEDFLERGLRHLDQGYDAATGMVYPHKPSPKADVTALIANRLPSNLYFSGPGYVLDRRRYYQVCNIKRVDGFVDICLDQGEIPLQKMNIVKDPKMVMWTDLPSTGQKRMWLGAQGLGVMTLMRLFRV